MPGALLVVLIALAVTAYVVLAWSLAVAFASRQRLKALIVARANRWRSESAQW